MFMEINREGVYIVGPDGESVISGPFAVLADAFDDETYLPEFFVVEVSLRTWKYNKKHKKFMVVFK